MACLLCMMMSQLHHADVIYIRVSHMGRVIWYLGRVSHAAKKTRGARLRAWADALPESDGECGHVRRSNLTPFSPVASSLPPLHGGMVKT
jgi:hypothetical protein